MTKEQFVKMLDKFDDDDIIVIGDWDRGWCNIDDVKKIGSVICIMEDMTRPFSSDN